MTAFAEFVLKLLTVAIVVASAVFAVSAASAADDWTLAIMPIGGWLIFMGLFLYRSLISVPTLNYGDYRAFDKRLGITVDEGLHWRWWWQRVRLYPYQIKQITVKENFTTQDQVDMTIEGMMQYQPDREFITFRFAALSEETIVNGLSMIIREEFGVLAGRYGFKHFIEELAHIARLINCVLRMKTPPHKNIRILEKSGLSIAQIEQRCQMNNVEISNGNEIGPECRIDFYRIFSHEIKDLLSQEEDIIEERSRIEEKYAIDVDHFNLAEPSWTEEFKQSMEKQRRAEAEVAAQVKRAESVMEWTQKFREKNRKLDQSAALHAAMAVQGLSTHQTIAVEGQSSVFPIIQPPAQPQPAPPTKRDSSDRKKGGK